MFGREMENEGETMRLFAAAGTMRKARRRGRLKRIGKGLRRKLRVALMCHT